MDRNPLIKNIPKELLPEEVFSLQLIEPGLNNKNYLVNRFTLVKEYLSHQETIDPARNRYYREKEALLILKDNPHVPQFLQGIDQDGQYFLARKWVEGNVLTLDRIQISAKQVVDALIAIHSVKVPSEASEISHLTSLDYFQVIPEYIQAYRSNYLQGKIPEHMPSPERIEQTLQNSLEKVNPNHLQKPQVLLHGDLILSNILITKTQAVLIDWEYSAVGSPLIDLAYLISQNDIPHETQGQIMQYYQQKVDFTLKIQEIQGVRILLTIMSGLWYSMKAESGKEFLHLAKTKFKALGIA